MTRLTITMTAKALWCASLSDGSTHHEGKGDFKSAEGQLSPWRRLLAFASEKGLTVTSLSLCSEDGRNWSLPSAGRNPKFRAFAEAERPVGYSCFRKVGVDKAVMRGCVGQLHAADGRRLVLKPTHGGIFPDPKAAGPYRVTVFCRSRHVNPGEDPQALSLEVTGKEGDVLSLTGEAAISPAPREVYFVVYSAPAPKDSGREDRFSVIEAEYGDGRRIQLWVEDGTFNCWMLQI